MSYQCVNPIVLVVFNRPQLTQAVFAQVRRVRPRRLYVISDGPREAEPGDAEKVAECRRIVSTVDWPCQVVAIFADRNMGCKRRVITGLSEVFSHEESAIVLEDDCYPTEAFFRFCDWGLMQYETDERVGIISGSNLLDYLRTPSTVSRAGSSMYINCWGWATWRRTWQTFDPLLSLQELHSDWRTLLRHAPLSLLQKTFWLGVFEHTIYDSTNWDFYLQYAFFKYGLISVYPVANLVENIGFGGDATHTKVVPDFVVRSRPDDTAAHSTMELPVPVSLAVDHQRDEAVLKVLYRCSAVSTFRLIVANRLRWLGLL